MTNPQQGARQLSPFSLLMFLVCGLVAPISPLMADTMTVSVEFKKGSFNDRFRNVLGNAAQENVENALSLLNAVKNGAEDPVYLTRLYEKAPKEIRTALRPFGYYQPDIDADLNLESSPPKATFKITKGPPVLVKQLDINFIGEGLNDPELHELVGDFPLKKDDRLLHQAYEGGKQSFINKLEERGYFEAEVVTAKVAVDPVANTSSITLTFFTGPRYNFGAVEVSGNHLNARVVENLVTIEPGQPFRQEKLQTLQEDLSSSPWFAGVDVEVNRNPSPAETVPVNVTVTPDKQNAYNVGVGYGTDTGARVSAGYERRWLNDDGASLIAEFDYAELLQQGTIRVQRPAFSNRLDNYALAIRYKFEDTDTSESTTRELAFTQQGRWRGWRDTLGLIVRVDDFTIGNQNDRSLLVMPTASIARTEADNLIFPRRGYSLILQLRGTTEAFGSDLDFMQLAAYSRAVLPAFGPDRLLMRANFGVTWTQDFAELPPDLRFLTGGDRSVRGFGYETLGPRDSDNDVIGGRYLSVFSVEYEYRLDEEWALAAFTDIGNAYNEFTDLSDPDLLEQSIGFGGRWLSPVGMIRLDLATVVTESDYPIRLHLTVGPDL